MKNSGHRLGASGTTSENTLEGYRESSAKPEMRGFRYWEFDIRESSDGTVFVFHDDTIDVGGKQSEISQMPFSEIKRAGSQRGISIPLFSEVCEELGDSPEMVMVEIIQKMVPHLVLKIKTVKVVKVKTDLQNIQQKKESKLLTKLKMLS